MRAINFDKTSFCCMFNTKVHLDIWLTSVMMNQLINCILLWILFGLNIWLIKKNEILWRRNFSIPLSWEPNHTSACDERSGPLACLTFRSLTVTLIYWEHSCQPETEISAKSYKQLQERGRMQLCSSFRFRLRVYRLLF